MMGDGEPSRWIGSKRRRLGSPSTCGRQITIATHWPRGMKEFSQINVQASKAVYLL
jgi:hypothetical protein